jgi:hypothetical protein
MHHMAQPVTQVRADALTEREVKVFYVTHMFDLAEGIYRLKMDAALFLRAERLGDGRRTFQLTEAEPLPTSYGEDLHHLIFGSEVAASGRDASYHL